MLKATFFALLGLAVFCTAGLVARAEEKAEKPVTLKGEITCTKCGLGETKACGNAITVKEGDKEVVYYFKDKGKGAPYHGDICTGPKKGSVTGATSTTKVDGKVKFWITPAKDGVKFD